MFIFLVRKIYLFIIEFDREKIRQLDYIYIYIFFLYFRIPYSFNFIFTFFFSFDRSVRTRHLINYTDNRINNSDNFLSVRKILYIEADATIKF